MRTAIPVLKGRQATRSRASFISGAVAPVPDESHSPTEVVSSVMVDTLAYRPTA